MQEIRLFLKYMRRARAYWHIITLTTICDVMVSAMGMLLPLLSVVIFDYAYPQRDLGLFTIVTVIGFGFYFLDFILSAHIDYLNLHTTENISAKLSTDVFSRIQQLPMRFFGKTRIGDLTVRVTEDIPSIVSTAVTFLPEVLVESIKLIVFFYITFTYDPIVTFLSLLSVPLYMWETQFFTKKLESIEEDSLENEGVIIESLQSRVRNIRLIKALNQQDTETQRFEGHIRRSFVLSLKESIVTICNVLSNSLTIQVWTTLLAWYLGYQVIQGALTLGQMIALTTYLGMLSAPIHAFMGLYQEARMTLVAMRRVDGILTEPLEADVEDELPVLRAPHGHITFTNVQFAYDADTPVFTDFSLDIPAGKSVALVGDSGSGKSTLIDLLLRFYAVQDGSITIDHHDIAAHALHSVRNNIGVVFQHTEIIPGTIRDNICYGDNTLSDKELQRIIVAAHFENVVDAMPDGLDTVLGPQGRALSGGQAQRLAIARVLAANPRILIFDEATSALDAESEFQVQEAINSCMGEHTVIIVAHRLATIKQVDEIIVLEEGSIVERGTFTELLDAKAKFFRMYNLQHGGFQEFLRKFNTEVQRHLRYDSDLSLIMGHVPEARALLKHHDTKAAAQLMDDICIAISKTLRIMDFAAVYSDDKIVVALPETSTQGASQLNARIRDILRTTHFASSGQTIRPHWQSSVAGCGETSVRFGEDLIAQAAHQLPRKGHHGSL